VNGTSHIIKCPSRMIHLIHLSNLKFIVEAQMSLMLFFQRTGCAGACEVKMHLGLCAPLLNSDQCAF